MGTRKPGESRVTRNVTRRYSALRCSQKPRKSYEPAKAPKARQAPKVPKSLADYRKPRKSPPKARGSSSEKPNHSQNGEKCPYKARKPADGETAERVAFRGVWAKSRFFGGKYPEKPRSTAAPVDRLTARTCDRRRCINGGKPRRHSAN